MVAGCQQHFVYLFDIGSLDRVRWFGVINTAVSTGSLVVLFIFYLINK